MIEKTTEVGKSAQEVADVVVESTKPLAEFSMDKMQQFFDAAQHILQQYGGDAVDLGLNALRIDAFSSLIPGIILVILCFISYKIGCLFIPIAKEVFADYKEKHPHTSQNWMDTGTGTLATLCYLLSILSGMGGIVLLLDVWSWVGIFYPEVYAVHKFLL